MTLRLPALALVLATLAGCGGGGSSSTASGTTYNVQTVWQNFVTNGYSYSGTCSTTTTATTTASTIQVSSRTATLTYPVTCSVYRTVGSGVNVAFEGQTTYQNSGTDTVSGVTVDDGTNTTVLQPYVDSFSLYSNNSSFSPVGQTHSATSGIDPENYYEVVQPGSAVTLPSASAVVGSTGVIATFNRYTDQTKTTQLGTTSLSYAVVADAASTTTPATALLQFVRNEYDMGGNRLSTETTSWRIDSTATGNPAFVTYALKRRLQGGTWTGALLTLFMTTP